MLFEALKNFSQLGFIKNKVRAISKILAYKNIRVMPADFAKHHFRDKHASRILDSRLKHSGVTIRF